MKKLSVLIALALCLTIGGAYAAWTYSTNAIGNTNGGNVAITMGNKVSDAAYGTLVATSTIAFVIEPETEVDGFVDPEEYKPAIDSPTGVLTITFTPDANAPEIYHSSATAIKISLTVTSGNYDGGAIMSSTRTIQISGVGSGANNWTNNGDGTFTCTIDAATICGLIDLADVTLDTPDKYDSYNTAVGNTTVTIAITDNVG